MASCSNAMTDASASGCLSNVVSRVAALRSLAGLGGLDGVAGELGVGKACVGATSGSVQLGLCAEPPVSASVSPGGLRMLYTGYVEPLHTLLERLSRDAELWAAALAVCTAAEATKRSVCSRALTHLAGGRIPRTTPDCRVDTSEWVDIDTAEETARLVHQARVSNETETLERLKKAKKQAQQALAACTEGETTTTTKQEQKKHKHKHKEKREHENESRLTRSGQYVKWTF